MDTLCVPKLLWRQSGSLVFIHAVSLSKGITRLSFSVDYYRVVFPGFFVGENQSYFCIFILCLVSYFLSVLISMKKDDGFTSVFLTKSIFK